MTTRLHRMVLALKNGVPPLVVDPVAGGAKILRQAAVIEWPVAFSADSIDDVQLETASDLFEWGEYRHSKVIGTECGAQLAPRIQSACD